jgi:integrase/recombinase XerC
LDGLDSYLRHLRDARRVSPHTFRAYEGDLRRFATFLDEAGIGGVADVKASDLKAYAASLLGEGAARTSVARRVAAVRGFFRHLVLTGALDGDPTTAVRTPKARRKLPRALTTDQLERLLAAPTGDGFLAVRDRAALELLYSGGLRNAELVGLKLEDLDLPSGLCRVMGKGARERVAVVGRYARRAIEAYLPLRAAAARAGAGTRVFLNRLGTPLSDRSLRRVLERLLVKADLPQGVTPHTLRHTFATHLLERGANLKEVQQLLGHRHLSSTQIYTHLSPEHLAAAYDAAHPRAKAARPKAGEESSFEGAAG